MSYENLTSEVFSESLEPLAQGQKKVGLGLIGAGVLGAGIGFLASGNPAAGWVALLTATVLTIGLAMVGPLLSAIFQITGTKWGRAYRRLAEGSVVLMPVGVVAVLVLFAGGSSYLPWMQAHPHLGGKAVWLTRGFWDVRVLALLLAAYGVGLAFVRHSLRRDFCVGEVRAKYSGFFSNWAAKGITKQNASEESARSRRRMDFLAPCVAIVYGVAFSLLGIDLIMALEPDWFSTLFGAWYFIGNIFAGLALLAIAQVILGKRSKFGQLFTPKRMGDLATVLLAFCLINGDFFWNQYLTIWYANLPEETFYLIERTADTELPWRSLSFISLTAFFVVPFLALLIRKIKRSGVLLVAVSIVVVFGVFLARFIEIAPPLLQLPPGSGMGALVLPLVSAALVLLGFLGAGLFLYSKWFLAVPVMVVGDEIFQEEFGGLGENNGY
jgi:hypothetical protein